ncbi:type VII secretion protein EssA [Lactovum odontotermitis]
MKRRQALLFSLFCGLLLFISIRSYAENDGRLHLDPNIITNSGGGIGTVGDYPIRNELFTPEMDQLAKAQDKEKISGQQKSLNFSGLQEDVLYATNTEKVTKKLFTADYQPQVIKASAGRQKNSNALWYGLIIIVGVLFALLAIFLGKKNAERNLRKRRKDEFTD